MDVAHPVDHPGPPARPRPVRRWPLVALVLSTGLLAASAVQVVGSSIEGGPTRPVEFARVETPPRRPVEPPGRVDDPPPAPKPAAKSTVRPPTPKPSPVRPSIKTHPAPATDRTPSRPSTTDLKSSPASDDPPGPPRPAPPELRRIRVRDGNGKALVARIHGEDGSRVAALLPDGQIGWPAGIVPTDEPFVPSTMAEVRDALLAAEFKGFTPIETSHYLVLTRGSAAFAHESANTLENLYASLIKVFDKRGVPVHEAEFPLVAVIYKTEDDFRREKKVAPDVQAFYEIQSNRIFLYESSARDQRAPEVSALRKPQTVAHEGTHQILQNIGLHPRLAPWPLWLVEGLAEYCASPRIGKSGVPTWVGLGQVNLLHIVTIRDLDDPLSTQVQGAHAPTVIRDRTRPLVEYLVTRNELTPTDYALSWALAYHLAVKRTPEFLDFLREMSQLKPLSERTPEENLRSFKAAFGDNLVKLDAAVLAHLRKLSNQVEALPYYAVMFEQVIDTNRLYRAAFVSQSPLMIRQWIEKTTHPRGAEPRWQVVPHPSHARALLTAKEYMGGPG